MAFSESARNRGGVSEVHKTVQYTTSLLHLDWQFRAQQNGQHPQVGFVTLEIIFTALTEAFIFQKIGHAGLVSTLQASNYYVGIEFLQLDCKGKACRKHTYALRLLPIVGNVDSSMPLGHTK